MDDVTQAVARQYSEYAYPKPIDDIAAAVARGAWDFADPARFWPLLWPEAGPRENLEILVAGCGTQQAAWLAYANPTARVTGIDLSEASLAHQRYLRDKHGIANMQLYQGDLREAGALGKRFDLVVSTGVLHHMADPGEGLRALKEVLEPDGAMMLMVYGAVGRAGVYMFQDACRRLGLGQDAESVALVRQMLEEVAPSHPLHGYVTRTEELKHDEAIVDTFLHTQDRAYTVPQLLQWLEENGLEQQAWANNRYYYPDLMTREPLRSAIKRLPEPEQWATVENLRGLLGVHTFTARLAGRAVRPDFSRPGWLGYRPHMQPGVAMAGPTTLQLREYRLDLNPAASAAVQAVDGRATIADILAGPGFAEVAPAERDAFGSSFFERLWRMGAVMLELFPQEGGPA